MTWTHILAKSVRDPDKPQEEEKLAGHTYRVMESCQVLGEVLAPSVSEFIGEPQLIPAFQEALVCTAWLHDLGKANNHFQEMIRGKRRSQGIRHERISFFVAHKKYHEFFKDTFDNKGYPNWLYDAVLLTILGHHLKQPDRKERFEDEVTWYGEHLDIRAWLQLGNNHWPFLPDSVFKNETYSLSTLDGLGKTIGKTIKKIRLPDTLLVKRFIAVLKSCFLCADAAGSALPINLPPHLDHGEWMKAKLKTGLSAGDLEKVVNQKLQGKPPRLFQKQVMDDASQTLVLCAGCGTGKTAAAYLWASRKAIGKRLFFCYPTTITSAEGFSGYLQDPDFEAILISSRSHVDYRLLENMPPRPNSDIEMQAMKIASLKTWPIPVVVCTANTVLGILQNERRSLYTTPSLFQSIFVFDEIHSFSPRLFGHLLRFLEIFEKTPVLLMTATLPRERLEALESVCSARGGLRIIEGPKERECAKRYLLEKSDMETAWQHTEKVIDSGGKVLWIANTVPRVMEIAKLAGEKNLPVQPFHSRYRYKDRLERQRNLIDAFQKKTTPVLAVSSQIAEMSLDISADLLISEYAPIPSMMQRLGRLNRFEDIPSSAKTALFVLPPDPFPYVKKEEAEGYFRQIEKWLDKTSDGQPVSQTELAEAFSEFSSESDGDSLELKPHYSDWFDVPRDSPTGRHALMEPGRNIEVIREEDINEGNAVEMAIPMPIPAGNEWVRWRRKGRFFIVPSGTIDYDPFWGGRYAQQINYYDII